MLENTQVGDMVRELSMSSRLHHTDWEIHVMLASSDEIAREMLLASDPRQKEALTLAWDARHGFSF